MKAPALLPLAAALLLAACSRSTDSATAPVPETAGAYERALSDLQSELASVAAPATQSDSLSYFLGVCEGMTYGKKLRQISEDQRDEVNPDDYLLGLHSVLAGDTTTASYARGVSLGIETARYLNTLESQGVAVNRRLLAATIAAMLDNPALDSITKNHADSIAGMIIYRHRRL